MAVTFKQIKKLVFGTNEQEDINLANLRYLRQIIFDFIGTCTVTGANADGVYQEDGLLKTALKVLELTANGSDKFVNSRGLAEYFRRAIMSGSAGVLLKTALGSAGAKALRAHVVLDFDALLSKFKFPGRINTDPLNSLEMRVEFGDGDTIGAPGTLIASGSDAYVTAGELEIIGVYDDNRSGEIRGGRNFMRRVGNQREVISGASEDIRIKLPRGVVFDNILLVAVLNGARSNALINNVRIQFGEDRVRWDMDWSAIQGKNVEDYGLTVVTGVPPYAGLAVLDFDPDKDTNINKILNALQVKDEALNLILDVNAPTGVTYVDAYYYSLDPRGVGKPL